jgi:predicted transcriptional regulator of viral defense system
MACGDIPTWFLANRLAVINLAAQSWQEARQQLAVAPGVAQAVCLRRLADHGTLRHVRRGLYVVVDPAREAPQAAIASGAFSHVAHYITTDQALAIHGLIDQPIPVITVATTARRLDPIGLGVTVIRPVEMADHDFKAADQYATTIEGFKVFLASRTQAVVDALAQPHWMTHFSLLPEILRSFDSRELAELAAAALGRSQAAAQRLAYLLEDAGQPIPDRLVDFVPLNVADLIPGRRRAPFSTRWRIYG